MRRARGGRGVLAEAAVDAATAPSTDPDDHLRRLYESERGRLLRLAALLLGERDAAEDVVQDAFAALHRRWDSLTDPSAASAYLSASVANGARSVLRRRRVALRHLRVSEPEAAPAADVAALLADEHRSVVEAVRKLPHRQQQVVVLRYWSGLSESQIANALGIAIGTVKSNAARGLANVQRQLEAESRAD